MADIKRMPFVFFDEGDVWVQEGDLRMARKRIREFTGNGPNLVYESSMRVVKKTRRGKTIFTITSEGGFMYKGNPGTQPGSFTENCKRLQVQSVIVEIRHVDGKEPELGKIGEDYKISYTEVPKEEEIIVVKREHGGHFCDLCLCLQPQNSLLSESILDEMITRYLVDVPLLGYVEFDFGPHTLRLSEISRIRGADSLLCVNFDQYVISVVSGKKSLELSDGSRHRAVSIKTVSVVDGNSLLSKFLNKVSLQTWAIQPVIEEEKTLPTA